MWLYIISYDWVLIVFLIEFLAECFFLERFLVCCKLKTGSLPDFYLPPSPTVYKSTRLGLEGFIDCNPSCDLTNFSDSNYKLLKDALNRLVSVEFYKRQFPMSCLDGFNASKMNPITQYHLTSQKTMAELGGLILSDCLKGEITLNKLKGKKGRAIIEACKSHGEFRLEEGVEILTDNWHKRFYWLNTGGSHHMSVLCHELVKQNEEWSPEVEIKEYTLNPSSLSGLKDKISIFVFMKSDVYFNYTYIFKSKLLKFDYLGKYIGLFFLDGLATVSSLENYQLVFIDHSKKYSKIALKKLEELVKDKKAMRFEKFLDELIVSSKCA